MATIRILFKRVLFFLLQLLAWPLSLLYGLAARMRRYVFQVGLFQTRQLPCRVISVGNITTGGTGKTPMTLYIARLVQQLGLVPVVVSRGYKGSFSKKGGVVSDGHKMFMEPQQSGDEPFMMAGLLPGVPVVVGRRRYEAGLLALEKFSPDVIILDDGFQHFQLVRDIDLVLLDSAAPLGNGQLLPAGSLREPASYLDKAQAIIFTRSDNVTGAKPWPGLKKIGGDKPTFTTTHRSQVAKIIPGQGRGSDRAVVENDLSLGRAFVFSGLAKNSSFLKSLEHLKAEVVGTAFFRDHHAYSQADLSRIAEQAATSGADVLITTEKDHARLSARVNFELDLVVVGVEISFKGRDQERFNKFIQKSLAG